MSTTIMGYSTEKYQHLFQALNPEQRQAVEQIDGPLLVIAGPGTGKTQVITVRIAHILSQTDTPPESILALTFTESAATTMRQRLVELVGPTGYRVSIGTFHALANEILQHHPEIFGATQTTQPLSDVDKLLLIKRIVGRLELQHLRPINAPDYYLTAIIQAISDLKRESISVADWQKQLEAETSEFENTRDELTKAKQAAALKTQAKWQDLAVIYAAYQAELQAEHRFDYDDMITRVNAELQTNEALRLEYQERYLYVLVDEYQDTNAAQNQLVQSLSTYWGDEANLCVVGDPDQSIYRFQGASIENMVAFKATFPKAPVVVLQQGYRCPQNIYNAANGLVKHNQLRSGVLTAVADEPLVSTQSGAGQIVVTQLPTSEWEAEWIASQIRQELDKGVLPEQIAVLTRLNRDVETLLPALTKAHIPVSIEGGQNILAVTEIAELITWWHGLHKLGQGIDDQSLFRLCLKPWWQVPTNVVIQAAQVAKVSRRSLWTVMTNDFTFFDQYQAGAGITQLEFYQLQQLAEQWQAWLRQEASLPVMRWIGQTLEETGWLTWAKQLPNWPVIMVSLAALQREIAVWTEHKPQLQLSEVLARLELYDQYRLPIKIESLSWNQQAVTLTTAHKAKGQEWDSVYIVGVNDGKWGNNTHREKLALPKGLIRHVDIDLKDRNEDERRLMYVALTRAKHRVTLTYPEQLTTGTTTKPSLPSEFVGELETWLSTTDQTQVEKWVEQASQQHPGWVSAVTTTQVWSNAHQVLGKLLSKFTLSASALNAYLRSPEQFLYQYVLRLAEPTNPTLAFGSAVHASLERYFKAQLLGEPVSLEQVLGWFTDKLEQEPLTQAELSERLTLGRAVLTQYTNEKLLTTHPDVWLVERRFGSSSQKIMVGDIPITGRIDRVDWIDSKAKIARVIDYKTGRPKTLGELAGTTASSHAELSEREAALPAEIRAPYKRQLLFYKLLAEHDHSFPATITEGSFEFIQPDKTSGKLVTRTLELPDSEVKLLTELIIEVMTELRSLSFLDTL